MPYPPAPWRLRGRAVIQLQSLAASQARALVPSTLALIPLAPGRTLGAIYLASYEAGSSRQYHELAVICAVARRRSRIGAWISHIYVDDEDSLAAGQEIWALPKQPAAFYQADGATEVKQGQTSICSFGPGESVRLGRWPVLAPALCEREGRVLWFRGAGSGRYRTGKGGVQVPPGSPISALGFGRGRRVYLDDLNMLVHAPRPA